MLGIICALLGVFIILVLSEYLWRKKRIKKEYGRKFVHISVGVYVAFWPYFLSLHVIAVLAAAFLVVLIISKKYQIFHAIHDVQRQTIGEILYPIGVLVSALLAIDPVVFTVSVLFVALADGMAAVIGKKYAKKRHTYITIGGQKSTIGSITYFVFAVFCMAVGYVLGASEAFGTYWFVAFVWLPLFCVLVEAMSPFGTDNLTIPVVVTITCNVLLQLSA